MKLLIIIDYIYPLLPIIDDFRTNCPTIVLTLFYCCTECMILIQVFVWTGSVLGQCSGVRTDYGAVPQSGRVGGEGGPQTGGGGQHPTQIFFFFGGKGGGVVLGYKFTTCWSLFMLYFSLMFCRILTIHLILMCTEVCSLDPWRKSLIPHFVRW